MDPNFPKIIGTLLLDPKSGLTFRVLAGEGQAYRSVDVALGILGKEAEDYMRDQIVRPLRLPEFEKLFWAFRGKVVQSEPAVEAAMGADRHAIAVAELVLREEQQQQPQQPPRSTSRKFTRAEIAAMVGPDFEAVRRQVDSNLPHAEQEAQYREYLVQRAAPRCEGMIEAEVRQFFQVYFEEMQAMIDRQTRALDFQDSLKRTAIRTAVRASVWDVFFQLFR